MTVAGNEVDAFYADHAPRRGIERRFAEYDAWYVVQFRQCIAHAAAISATGTQRVSGDNHRIVGKCVERVWLAMIFRLEVVHEGLHFWARIAGEKARISGHAVDGVAAEFDQESWTVAGHERHEMVQRAASISRDEGRERPIGRTRNFPVDARQNGADQQHGGYLFNGDAMWVLKRASLAFRGFIERSMRVISESLHGGRQVDLNISSVRNPANVANYFFRISIAVQRLCNLQDGWI